MRAQVVAHFLVNWADFECFISNSAALREFIGTNQMMAYMVMMATRLVELHRDLKPTGSLYLHCDPTAGHDLKIIRILEVV